MQLSPNEITFLGSMFENTNPLSPFVNNKKELTGEEAASLEEKGVLKNGSLTEEAKALLSPLAAPERCSRMILQKPFCLLEKYTYLADGKLTLAESDGKGLVITPLEKDSQPVVDVLKDFCPQSAIKNASFTVTLSAAHTMVLLACIDLCRTRALSSYLSGKDADLSFTADDVSAQMTSGFVNGLVYGLSGNCNVQIPDTKNTAAFMTILFDAGCLVAGSDQGTYLLAPQYRLLASSFLIYDSLMLLEAFELASENKVAASMDLCFCSGMHDIIAFSACPEGFEISSLSGEELNARLKDTLDCPTFKA